MVVGLSSLDDMDASENDTSIRRDFESGRWYALRLRVTEDRIQAWIDEEAVIDAGAKRFRPMLLTAAAVVVGASVILFDPIFQGLAVSLMAGEIASTILSRTAVPVIYYMSMKKKT